MSKSSYIPLDQIPLIKDSQWVTYHAVDDNDQNLEKLKSLEILLEKEISQQSRCYNRLSKRDKFHLIFLLSLTLLGTGGGFLVRLLFQESKNLIQDWNSTLITRGSAITCAEAYNDIVKCHYLDERGGVIETIGHSRINSSACYDVLYYLCRWSCDEVLSSPKDCKGWGSESYWLVGLFFVAVIIAISFVISEAITSSFPSNEQRTVNFFLDHKDLLREAKLIEAPNDSLNKVLEKTKTAIAWLR